MNHFYKELTQRVRPTDIIPHLFQKDVINQMDKEEIFAKERNHGITHAMRVLIKRVGDRNDHWFLTFIQSLKEAKYTEIAERMEAYVQESK
ncbi:hypothetical protein FSP39_011264 [Pinctada imbricata]|uniref:CARD domain-containing protein n=1 Tax=Pinctada imbricata TaxID=66713 RepID=A0AA88YI81_PINIB|nr:hypothetical protein FSP39_011264 [Pinctada imbricata]